MMEQVKFFKYATFFLVALNISMVAFFFITKPKGIPPRHGNRNALEILELDKTQKATFLQYAEAHKALMKDLNKEQKVLLKTYFQTLVEDKNLEVTDSLLAEVQALEKQKIESTYEHLTDVKSILNKEQQSHFQEFIDRVYEMILAESKKK